MLRCKQVSDALASKNYWELPLRQRFGLRMHVALCLVCGPFNRFIMRMQDLTRHYLRHEMNDPPPPDLCLDKEARERIKENLRAAEADDDGKRQDG